VTDPEQLGDPVLRAVAECWDDIQRHADPGQRDRLAALVDGTAEPDADEVRAALEDELLDILPPDHPVSQLLRSGTMLDSGLSERPEAVLADELRQLSHRIPAAGAPTGPAASSAVSPAASAAAGPPGGDFDRQVQARLLALPSLSADDARNWAIDADRGLIRLPRPDGRGQLPAFQFGPSGAPWPVVREINELLDAAGDPWGVACWWIDPHERLDAIPAALLGQGEDALLRLAANTAGEDY
jgi:hypothetical protein